METRRLEGDQVPLTGLNPSLVFGTFFELPRPYIRVWVEGSMPKSLGLRPVSGSGRVRS